MEKLPLDQWGVQARGGFWHGELFVFSVVRDSTHGLYQFDPSLPMDRAMLRLAGGVPGFKDGGLAEAQFSWPTGVCRSSGSAICVADMENHLIRTISGDHVSTRIGNGIPGDRDGQLAVAQLNKPAWISENDGHLVIIEKDSNRVRVLNKTNDTLTTVTLSGGNMMAPIVPTSLSRFSETFAITTASSIYTMCITSNPLIPKSTVAELSLAIGLAKGPFHSATALATEDGSEHFILFNLGSLIRVLTPDQEILEIPGIKFNDPSKTHLVIATSKEGRTMILDADSGSLHHFLFNPASLKQRQFAAPVASFAPIAYQAPQQTAAALEKPSSTAQSSYPSGSSYGQYDFSSPLETPSPASPPTFLPSGSTSDMPSLPPAQDNYYQQQQQSSQIPFNQQQAPPQQQQQPPQQLQQSLQSSGGSRSDPRLSDPRLSDPRLSDPRLSDPRLSDPRLQTQTPPSSVAPNAYPTNINPGTPANQPQQPQQPQGGYPSGYPPQGYPPNFDQGMARSGNSGFVTADSRLAPGTPGTPPPSGLPSNSPYATPDFKAPPGGSSSQTQLPPYGMPPQQQQQPYGSSMQTGTVGSPTYPPPQQMTQQQYPPQQMPSGTYGTAQVPPPQVYQVAASSGGAYAPIGGFTTQMVQQAPPPQIQQTAVVGVPAMPVAAPVQILAASSSHSQSPKKTPAWAWFDHGTVWQSYDANIAQQLDDAYWKGAVEFFFTVGSTQYRIDLTTDQPRQHPVGQPSRTRKVRPPQGYKMPLGGKKR